MQTIVKMVFGSHLYGTDTPDSDRDYKGVFIPDTKDIYLGRIPNTYHTHTKSGDGKNTSADVDTEIHSLHHFIDLACKGEMEAIDMLHAPPDMWLESSPIWERIISERHRFYTANMKAFKGYIGKQANKYGVKGSRIAAARSALSCMLGGSSYKLSAIWDILPTGEYLKKMEIEGNQFYEVCGRKIQNTLTIGNAYEIVKKILDNYGERAKMAESNEGIDWKAISHAFRAAYELRELYTERTITFPLPEKALVKKIKTGAFDFKYVWWRLEELVEEIEILASSSNLPDKVSRKFWNDFICMVIGEATRLAE